MWQEAVRMCKQADAEERAEERKTKEEEARKRRLEDWPAAEPQSKKRRSEVERKGLPQPDHPPSQQELREDVLAFVKANAVPGTEKRYSNGVKQFRAWCEAQGLVAFPASEETVAAFLKHKYETQNIKPSTARGYTSAIAAEYKFSSHPKPEGPLLRAVKDVIARKAPPPTHKDPISKDLLLRVLADSNRGRWIDARDDFMLVLLIVTGMRESEEVALRAEDVWIEKMPVNGGEQEVLVVFIQKSKTDQERIGHTVLLPRAKDERVCPLRLFERWSRLRSEKATHVFHARQKSAMLSSAIPCARLKYRLKRIGVNTTTYGSHSGRRTLATVAAKKGVQERLIKKHCNWRSDVVHQYIEESVENRLSVAAAVLDG